MAPKKFDCYMVRIGIGTHPKLARLTDGEFRAHVAGVLAVAAMAPIRGRLLVGELPAEAVDIARAAGVPARVAQAAMTKLRAVGVLEHDDELGCLRVHDWGDINPEPGADPTNTERQRRFRERRNASRNAGNGHVTDTEVKKEKKDIANAMSVEPVGLDATPGKPKAAVVTDVFAYWQQRCGHPQAKLTIERRRKVEARLKEGYSVEQIKRGIDGAAVNPPANSDSGVVYDDLVSICRNGSQLERYIGRAETRRGRRPAVESSADVAARMARR